MPLSQSQKSLIEKARNVGGSDMAVPLDDAACCYLLARLAHDLNLAVRVDALGAGEVLAGGRVGAGEAPQPLAQLLVENLVHLRGLAGAGSDFAPLKRPIAT